jgi:hypothetical protein
VSDDCDVKPESRYANDTGLDGALILTGSQNFTVREIEVFELTDKTVS